jgi:hypothetical protein
MRVKWSWVNVLGIPVPGSAWSTLLTLRLLHNRYSSQHFLLQLACTRVRKKHRLHHINFPSSEAGCTAILVSSCKLPASELKNEECVSSSTPENDALASIFLWTQAWWLWNWPDSRPRWLLSESSVWPTLTSVCSLSRRWCRNIHTYTTSSHHIMR